METEQIVWVAFWILSVLAAYVIGRRVGSRQATKAALDTMSWMEAKSPLYEDPAWR